MKFMWESLNSLVTMVAWTAFIGLGFLGFTGHIKIIDFAGKMAIIIN